MTERQRDPFTGIDCRWQRARVDEDCLQKDGPFDVMQFNAVYGETCNIADVSSMAAIYGYTESYFRRWVLPELEFVRRAGPVPLSCVSSLMADASNKRAAARARQVDAGRMFGAANLIRRTQPETSWPR